MSETTTTVRIKYSKRGMIRFIGHLDTARAISRALRCSGLPLRFSHGFNPHVKLSFGPALPLGFSSDCEFFDVELTEPVNADEIADKIDPHMPEGLSIEKTALLSYRPSSLSKIIDRARYRITLPLQHFVSPEEIAAALSIAGNHEGKTARMRSYIGTLECAEKDDNLCQFDLVVKDVNKGAPAVSKMFTAFFNIDLFDIDGARMHRVEQWAEKSKLL